MEKRIDDQVGETRNKLQDVQLDCRLLRSENSPSLSLIHTIQRLLSRERNQSGIDYLTADVQLHDCLTHTNTSLFVDDSSIYKAGRNINQLQKVVQKDLDVLHDWCDRWGFKISIDKTITVLFTQRKDTPRIQLQLEGRPVKVQKIPTFLGVVFDHWLTWRQHIDYLSAKCGRRLSLMRAVSGTRWGASHQALITMYRMLIRSVLDYGSVAYDSAARPTLRRSIGSSIKR